MATVSQIVFIDSRVSDYQALVAGIASNAEVVVLPAAGGAVEWIAAHLAGRWGLDAIHIVSHGSPGSLYLGATTLDAPYLARHAESLAAIGASLTATGDILLYSCD